MTIAQITGRRNPRFSWFVDSLCNQVPADMWPDIQVLFIDRLLWTADPDAAPWDLSAGLGWSYQGYHDSARCQELENVVEGRFEYEHLPPLPSAWQGPFRQTSRDFFCASLARNSAIVACRSPYLLVVDDLAVLGENWFAQARHAAEHEYLVGGMYKKLKNLVVEQGRIKSFDEFPAGVDSRWALGSDNGIKPWVGAGIYGCSFGVPLDAALEVDGFDGVGNGEGGEDTDFGLRVERAGWQVFLNQNLYTAESEEAHHEEPSLPRERKMVAADRLPAGYVGEQWSDHVFRNRSMTETDRILPIIGDNLRAVRERYLGTGLVPIPAPGQVDWRDGAKLSDL